MDLGTRTNQFYACGDFNEALGIINEKYGINPEQYREITINFLNSKGGVQPAELETSLQAEAMRLSRKAALKNLFFTNPAPLVSATLEALTPVDNDYAARFLGSVSELMTKNGENQAVVNNILVPELGRVFSEYSTFVRITRERIKEGHKLTREMEGINSFYARMLDGLLDFTTKIVERKSKYVDFSDYRRRNGLSSYSTSAKH